ncbi:C-X-C chemokine receptor type 3-2-like [Carcharodon carcharias]|uniref:C-X-C chemokine receptor type 3-2-like n=1 Tax=Carcharodon carcharias TaxID=13397 RepID=UPI001B7E3F33|nr:C-X-C chemokine receptor type 3-2-like [Carcharodon carcharias]
MDNSTQPPVQEMTEAYYNYDDFETDFSIAQPCRPIVVEKFVRIFVPILYSLVLLLGALGNMLVILILGRYKRARRTITDTFILHLAIADVLLAFTLPFWAVEAVRGWVFGTVMCKLIGTIFALNLYSSILFLVCISFDRYLAIVHAIHMYRKRKPIYIHVTCLIVWALCLLLAMIDLIFREEYRSTYLNSTVCIYMFHPDSAGAWKLAIRVAHHTIGFFVPMVAMLYCYCMIFKTLCHAQMFERQKTLKVVIVIVVVFIICWLPYNTVLFVDTLQSLGTIGTSCTMFNTLDISRTITQTLGLIHSCLNPLLYAFIGVRFRHEMVRVLVGIGCLKKKLVVSRHAGKSKRASSAISDSETSTSHSTIW